MGGMEGRLATTTTPSAAEFAVRAAALEATRSARIFIIVANPGIYVRSGTGHSIWSCVTSVIPGFFQSLGHYIHTLRFPILRYGRGNITNTVRS